MADAPVTSPRALDGATIHALITAAAARQPDDVPTPRLSADLLVPGRLDDSARLPGPVERNLALDPSIAID